MGSDSELQQYYDNFCRGQWAVSDPKECLCHGSGWALSDVDTTHQCPIHYTGQSNPYDDELSELSELSEPIIIADLTLDDLIQSDSREAFVDEEEDHDEASF